MTAVAPMPNAALPPGMDWNPLAVGEAAMEAWTFGYDAWAGYLGRLAVASGPGDVLEAGVRLSLDSLDICSRIAATHLGALRTPLLNDA